MKRPATILGTVLFSVFILAALVGPALAPHSPLAQNLDQVLLPPGGGHLLGTDENGGDLLSMILFGARAALTIAGSTVLISLTVGTVMGATAGYLGGWIDDLIMRVVDVLLSFPESCSTSRSSPWPGNRHWASWFSR
jgi:peptide/nickel transport system permease protein